MRNRTEHILRLACLALAVLVLAQFIRTIFHVTPFFGVRVPAVPTLETNSPPGLNPAPAANPQGAMVPGMPAAKVATQTATNLSTNFAAIKNSGTNRILMNAVTNVVKNSMTNASTNMGASLSRFECPDLNSVVSQWTTCPGCVAPQAFAFKQIILHSCGAQNASPY